MTNILEVVQNEVYGVWYLVGAALVFFMQCGFAMVETGFTRAKNAGNIIMKNLMDFCIGTPMFLLLGFSLMLSEDYVMGLIGVPNLGYLRITQILTGLISFSTLFFVLLRLLLFQAQWQKEQSSALTAYTARLSVLSSIRLRRDGYGIQKAGSLNSAFTISQAPVLSTWLAV